MISMYLSTFINKRKNPLILTLKIWVFPILLYRALFLKEINTV